MGAAESEPVAGPHERNVHAVDGTVLPSKLFTVEEGLGSASRPTVFTFLHGLGERMSDYDETAKSTNMQKVLQAMPENSARPRIVLFDARGHGTSTGWERGGPHQFHWRCLGADMLHVAAAHTEQPWDPSYIFGGCSMGAAAAVWAALLSPRKIRGLVLYLVPTMWAGRQARRGVLEAKAASVRETDPVKYDVMLGAARADFPPRDDMQRLAETGVPVLVVNARDDPIHPMSSAEAVKEIFGQSATLVVVDKVQDAPSKFTEELVKWLAALPGCGPLLEVVQHFVVGALEEWSFCRCRPGASMAGAREQLKQIAETASLEHLQQLLAYAVELGIRADEGADEGQQVVDIRVLYPSGEVVLNESLPGRMTVGALLLRLGSQSEAAGRMSLLLGTDVLKRDSRLADLNLTAQDCLYLLRRTTGTYTEWKPVGTGEAQHDHVAKCVILGGAGVGKTALLRALCSEAFLDDIQPTIGIDFKIVHRKSEDGIKLKVQLWDTAGQPRFRPIAKSYMRGACGFLAVFSLCNHQSLQDLFELLEAAEENNREACRCICLVGTHADSPNPAVTEEEILQFARDKNYQYFAVSNKTGQGIDQPFSAWLDSYLQVVAH
ncbi:RAB13 [Symbiodinium sp. CCMP2456]|nr:RAB13 [Symbiodinium sp. CCMP2456]